MGVNLLMSFIKKVIPQAIKIKNISELAGSIAVIDANNIIYNFARIDEKHIVLLFCKFVTILMKYHIKPIVIFDSKIKSVSKSKTIEDRRKQYYEKTAFYHKIKKICIINNESKTSFNLEDTNKISCPMMKELFEEAKSQIKKEKEEIKEDEYDDNKDINILLECLKVEEEKLKKELVKPKGKDFEILQTVLPLMGIACFFAPTEAEKTCSLLIKIGIANICFSGDSDILAMGHSMFTNFNFEELTISEYSYETIITTLNLSHDQFVDMCTLMGTDHILDKIPHMNGEIAYNLIYEHGSILECLLYGINTKTLDISEEYIKSYEKAQQEFINKEQEIEEEKILFMIKNNITIGLSRIIHEHSFNHIKTIKYLRKEYHDFHDKFPSLLRHLNKIKDYIEEYNILIHKRNKKQSCSSLETHYIIKKKENIESDKIGIAA